MANDWWDKEALFSQLVSYTSGSSPNYSFRFMDTGSLFQVRDFALVLILSVASAPLGLCTLCVKAVWTKFLARCKLAAILSSQNMLFFVQSCRKQFQSSPPQENSSAIWTFMPLLLCSAPVVLQPLVLDAVSSASRSYARIRKDIVKGASAIVNQELMMAPVLSPVPVNPGKAQEALKTAHQVVRW